MFLGPVCLDWKRAAGTCTLSAFNVVARLTSAARLVEFDINGQRIGLVEAEVVWLRDLAGRGAGSSAARRDLAVLLQHVLGERHRGRAVVALSRGEARTARRLLEEERPPPSEGLQLLQVLLAAETLIGWRSGWADR